jgi:hypothetical protein
MTLMQRFKGFAKRVEHKVEAVASAAFFTSDKEPAPPLAAALAARGLAVGSGFNLKFP